MAIIISIGQFALRFVETMNDIHFGVSKLTAHNQHSILARLWMSKTAGLIPTTSPAAPGHVAFRTRSRTNHRAPVLVQSRGPLKKPVPSRPAG